jgi:hypothetical protein
MKELINWTGMISFIALPLIGIWDVWDNTNEEILKKVWGTDLILILSTFLIYSIFFYKGDKV